jgi:RNA polymerase sigma factor (TIGR02999 family)
VTKQSDITRLLHAWSGGDGKALEQLTPLVYQELRRLARGVFRSERPGHTLQPTALVHEAFTRLVSAGVSWQSRAHFYALAARQMRRILVNHAEGKRSAKRGGGRTPAPLEAAEHVAAPASDQIVEIDAALKRLAAFDERKSSILELHYFGGLTYEEMAEALGLSTSTLDREIRLAKSWLAAELTP